MQHDRSVNFELNWLRYLPDLSFAFLSMEKRINSGLVDNKWSAEGR
jgi:hypothetical protein